MREIAIAKEEEEVTAAVDLAVDHEVFLVGTGIEETGIEIEEIETGIVIGIVDVAAEGAEARVDVLLATVEVEAGV